MNTATTNVSKPVAQQTPKPSAHRFNLEVDGKVGHDTVKALQSWLGTVQDGIVSGQSNKQKKYLVKIWKRK